MFAACLGINRLSNEWERVPNIYLYVVLGDKCTIAGGLTNILIPESLHLLDPAKMFKIVNVTKMVVQQRKRRDKAG
jgi:hypothetical protein